MMTMTMHQAGHRPDRARPVATFVCSSGWRMVAPATPAHGTTGLPAYGSSAAGTTADFGANATGTASTGLATHPCTIKRPTRSLGTRST
jgi:hypothetical protein